MDPQTTIRIAPPDRRESWSVVIVSNYVPIGELAEATFDRPLLLPLAVAHPASFVTERTGSLETFHRVFHPIDRHGNPVDWRLYDFAVAVDQATFDWMLLEKLDGRPMPAFGCLAPDSQTFVGDFANAASGLGWFTGNRERCVQRISLLLAASVDTRSAPSDDAPATEVATDSQ